MPAAISESEYIERIRKVSTSRYDLIGFAEPFHGNGTKCKCRCLVDGNEWDTATIKQLIRGNGCPQCGGVRRWSANDYAERINKASMGKHSFVRWDVAFKNQLSKAVCECTACLGEFSSIASNLINRGTGCPTCQRSKANKKCSKTKMKKIDNVVDEVKRAIGNEIDFVRVTGAEMGTRTKMIFSCSKHSIEFQIAAHHVVYHRQRCPLCNPGGFNMAAKGFLYAIKSLCGKYIKVGITNIPKDRLSQLKRSTPFEFSLEKVVSYEIGSRARDAERKIHKSFESAGFSGFDGSTEWMLFDEAILEMMDGGL